MHASFQVKPIPLAGIMLLPYVKQEHAAHISEVEAETVGSRNHGENGEFLVGTGRALVPKVSSLLHDTTTTCVPA